MILGVGIDLCGVERMREALERRGFAERFFTERESEYIRGRGVCAAESAAACFAAKEAAMKALGCGMAVAAREIEMLHDANGAPYYCLYGEAKKRMEAAGGTRMHLSVTHEGAYAAAVAVLEGKESVL